ncbi:ubiquitin carboxyl-terminal hydrolase MINDY-3 isoform X2 [Hippocampus zosterae]|uniref:ubiquitin carboxyl-terminal hydrolase MINDY-3 isoform X2 n=1 Tax=Hippocampus zosterae TaxID=109293 RepID=UPI00223E22AE|nr:ubiquitin carboxyl-terminal hydrolase MINDY-3 isoform X2 [Hippocampus zosterae]
MSDLNKELVDLVWGRPTSGAVSASIFRRWTQGFVFSENEHTALEQFEGGPCAVIVPVQAFLLKTILFNRETSNWRHMTEEEQKTILCSALSEILESACSSTSTGFCLVSWAKGQSPQSHAHTKAQTQSQAQDMPVPESSQPLEGQQPNLQAEVLSLFHTWRGCCGVLLFLYSVILTKGIENIRNEIQDTMEPLIDPVHGHGSQSLVNLLITGHAVSNVWDGDRECSGMKLHGIHKQASVGFLTLMESLHYCKVGAFLKSPKFPIWIIGSETHLSVFFTKELTLVGPECPSEQARRVFQSFDPEDNGFIPDSLLQEVMKALDLVSEPEYVNLVKNKLDPENLGIILLGPFLLEFFPDQDSGIPDSFPVYHYNGLKQSNHNERVEYVEGTALVLGFEDPMVRTDDTPVKRCLQTKWPYIELLWTTERSPSLN